MDYEQLLTQAREDRSHSRWESSARSAEEAIKHLGGEPTDDWIAARLIFGSSVACGELVSHVESAVERVGEAVLELIERNDVERVGPALRTLGYLFELRSSGTRSTNLGLAVHCFRRALKHYPREVSPEDWGHLNVAIALDLRERLAAWAEEGCRVRDDGDYRFRRVQVEMGISALRNALEVFDEEHHPDQHREATTTMEAFLGLLDRLPQQG